MVKREITKIYVILLISLLCHINLSSQTIERYKREDVEWLDIWLPNVNKTGLPRILLIGNSITRQYYPEVQKLLSSTAYVDRISTSKSLGDHALLEEISLVLSYGDYDIIHVNNGMHGWDYSEEEYSEALPNLYNLIRKRAKKAKIIWATTTPIRSTKEMGKFNIRNERVKKRNRIVIDFFKDKKVYINDLYKIAVKDSTFYSLKDGIHPNSFGVSALANEVARILKYTLNKNSDFI